MEIQLRGFQNSTVIKHRLTGGWRERKISKKKTASGEKNRNECENNEIIHNLYERLRWVWAGRGERSEKLYERGKDIDAAKGEGGGGKSPSQTLNELHY